MIDHAALFAEHIERGARIRAVLRAVLAVFYVLVLLTEPPAVDSVACWVVVIAYAVWLLAVLALRPRDANGARLVWIGLLVDVAIATLLTLISDTAAVQSWTPYLLIDAFFVVPLIAAAQLSPVVGTAVALPTVAAYLVSAIVTAGPGKEPLAYAILPALVLGAIGLGAVLLSRLQRFRVRRIAALLDERTLLLDDLLQVEQNERAALAEALHDGALQYVLAARMELDDVAEGEGEALERVRTALTESTRLLRGTLTGLHPAVLDTAGLAAALRDLVDTAPPGIALDLRVEDWPAELTTPADHLLLATARELVTNVIKHADARRAIIELSRADGLAILRVIDDGRGMGGVDLAGRLRKGHLGLASRRVRLEAAGGSLTFGPGTGEGTIATATVPVPY